MYHVLVCDDEKDIVSALTVCLRGDGYRVFTAANGREALDIAASLVKLQKGEFGLTVDGDLFKAQMVFDRV